MQSNEAGIRLAAAVLLVQAGDYSHLHEVDELVIDDNNDQASMVAELVSAVARQRADSAALIGPMIAWLRAKSDFARSVASSILRDSRSEAALAPLRDIALFDESPGVRFNATVGVMQITRSGDIPQYRDFIADEARYIAAAKRRTFEPLRACSLGTLAAACPPPPITVLRVLATPRKAP